jgi:hypothetical protein
MGARQLGLRDVSHGRPPSRARLLAPLRYLQIHNPEKTAYDFIVPGVVGGFCWIAYLIMTPRVHLFGDAGLLRFARDLLIMAVPFITGALAAVAMGSPGQHLDRRPVGAELWLDGRVLTLRQFVCYLLGYLCFVGLITLGAVVFAGLMHDAVIQWTEGMVVLRHAALFGGSLILSLLLSSLVVTTFWALYFLTDVVNRP